MSDMITDMKAFIFDPLWEQLITPELESALSESGLQLIITKELAPIVASKALFEGDEERILCLNPYYVSWKLSVSDYKLTLRKKSFVTQVV